MLAVVTLVLTLVVKVRDPEQRVRFFHVPDGYFRINIPLGIEIPLSLRYVWVIRTALLLGTVLWLATSFGTDFSSYFPSKLRMNVFYDEPGIEAALSEFTESEKTALGIASDWQARRREYYVRLKKPLARLWSALNP